MATAPFLGAAAAVRNRAGVHLTHKQRVTRLYRHSLKCMLSWVVDRDIFIDDATKLRARFDSVKGPVNGGAARFALSNGEAELAKFTHPDRYVVPYMPGGSAFMRNSPPPPEVVYGEGNIPADASTGTNTPVWPDMVPVTFRAEPPSSYLIDFYKKTIE